MQGRIGGIYHKVGINKKARDNPRSTLNYTEKQKSSVHRSNTL